MFALQDIPRTFPGHPALNDDGRDSLRRLLLAYARHNPSVGYCQVIWSVNIIQLAFSFIYWLLQMSQLSVVSTNL